MTRAAALLLAGSTLAFAAAPAHAMPKKQAEQRAATILLHRLDNLVWNRTRYASATYTCERTRPGRFRCVIKAFLDDQDAVCMLERARVVGYHQPATRDDYSGWGTWTPRRRSLKFNADPDAWFVC